MFKECVVPALDILTLTPNHKLKSIFVRSPSADGKKKKQKH